MSPLGRHLRATALCAGAAMLLTAPAMALDTDSIRVTGFVETSYQSATSAVDDRIVGRLYGPNQDQFGINAVQVAIERPLQSGVRGAGFTAKFMAGTSATPIKAAGLDLGPQADLYQAAVLYNLPAVGGDVQFAIGKLTSLLGVEVIESVLNPTASVGGQFIFLEDYTSTGLDVNWIPSARWSARVRIANGWDVVEDNNRGRTVFARLGLNPDASTSIALLGYSGPEQPDNGSDDRSGVELIVTRSHARGSVQLQLDAGHEDGIDADWTAAGLWATWGFNDAAELGLRADMVDDEDGARTSGALGYPINTGQRFGNVTASLNLRPTPELRVRPEVRIDYSDIDAFDGDDTQWTFALTAAFVY